MVLSYTFHYDKHTGFNVAHFSEHIKVRVDKENVNK